MAGLDVEKEIAMPSSNRWYPKLLVQGQVRLLQLAALLSIVYNFVEVMQNWNFFLHNKWHVSYFPLTE